MYYNYLILCFIYIFPISCATSNSIQRNLDKLFEYCFEQEMFNGHVLIYRQGEVIYNKSYGSVTYNSSKPINADTPFRLASLSKQFTAMAITMLKSEGKLNYDDDIQEFIDNFPYEGITIRHLLNQTSGIPEYQNIINQNIDELEKDFVIKGEYVDNYSILNLFATQKPTLDFPSNSSFDYSNTNYILLAQVIEQISGLDFGDFLMSSFFNPLNMNNTWVTDERDNSRVRALGYKRDLASNSYKGNEAPQFLKTYGDGGIFSSANDLLKWFNALDSGFIPKEELNQAYSKPKIGKTEGPYGFGWFVRTLPFNGNRALTHSGEFAGFSNAIFRDLDANTTAIILSNNSNKIRSEINSALVRILYGVPYDLPKISAEASLLSLILSGEIQKARQFYASNKDNELYDFTEQAFNNLGYACLKKLHYKASIEVFKWNIEMNPKSSNVYDSLAEAYLESGELNNALEYYSIAYKMDPENLNAKNIIDQLSQN